MAKITLTDLTSLANDTSAVNSLNANFTAIESYINDNVLSRDAAGETNTILNDLDFNSYDILNVTEINGEPVANLLAGATTASIAAQAAQTAAALSETNAGNSETAAIAAQAAAELALDTFDDIYLGAKASNPTLDNDGDALAVGAIYYNTTLDSLRIWSGSAWNTAVFDTDSAAFYR